MASPTQTEVESQLQNQTELLWAVRIRGVTATDDVVSVVDNIEQNVESDFAANIIAQANSIRSTYATMLTPQRVRDVLSPVLATEVLRLNGTDLTVSDALQPGGSIHDDFVDNNRWLKSRNITYGSVSAGGSNVGTGTVYRLTVDYDGNDLEGGVFPLDTSKTVECIRDANTSNNVVLGAELFEIRGTPYGRDSLSEDGSGQVVTVAGATTRDTQNFIQNPGFQQATPTTDGATLTALAGWTATSSIGNFQGNVGSGDNIRLKPNIAAASTRSITFTTNDTLTSDRRVRPNDIDVPHLIAVAVQRISSCDGDFTFGIGAQTTTTDVTTLTNSTWTWLVMPMGTKCWPRNWSQADVYFTMQLASNTTGSLDVGEVIIAPMIAHDGVWYRPLGSGTEFITDDVFTFSDSEADTAIIQSLLARGWGLSLPATADATQVTASGGRTLTFATSPDTVTASSGDFTSDGYKVGMTLTVAGTSSNNGTFTITNVTATVITVSSGFSAEGPLSATATLDAASSVSDPTVS